MTIITNTTLQSFMRIAHHHRDLNDDYALMAFAKEILALGPDDKQSYLALRTEICRQLQGEIATQRRLRAEGNALKAASQGDSPQFNRCRSTRLNNRDHITGLIKVLRLGKLWAAHAMNGDPHLLRLRESHLHEAQNAHRQAEHAAEVANALYVEHETRRQALSRELNAIELQTQGLRDNLQRAHNDMHAAHTARNVAQMEARGLDRRVNALRDDLTRARDQRAATQIDTQSVA